MIEDFEQFVGFTTDLGAGLRKEFTIKPPLSQAANKSNIKIAFPEPQVQPKLTRAEIQAQHHVR